MEVECGKRIYYLQKVLVTDKINFKHPNLSAACSGDEVQHDDRIGSWLSL